MKRKGFTLAEVLITLGIIGVVAAMTIPTLIANVNGAKYRSQFKKTLSTLNQAGRMAQAQYGWSFADIKDRNLICLTDNPEIDITMCALFNGTLAGATNLNKYGSTNMPAIMSEYNYRPTMITFGLGSVFYDQFAFLLADGSLITFNGYMCQEENYGNLCQGIIDVNGFSKPNKEVSCSSGKTKAITSPNDTETCIVKNDANHMTDIFPILYTSSKGVIPGSNAAAYVLNSAK